ncbi:hypothetical protein Ahy_A03g012294 [Arachis hypogaea]|uniref:Uncharacterized protein n=1 Tax=Arachis hypogaea TaxID=3818 RepID=A0A445DT00_ARAHY|nr:hypothetical protein Ahy_A03g012294 [Arachis hypogaea]
MQWIIGELLFSKAHILRPKKMTKEKDCKTLTPPGFPLPSAFSSSFGLLEFPCRRRCQLPRLPRSDKDCNTVFTPMTKKKKNGCKVTCNQELKEDDNVVHEQEEEEKPSQKKAGSEIDEIFAGKKRKKSDDEKTNNDKKKMKKKKKKTKEQDDNDDGGFLDKPSRSRKKTSDGLTIYTEDELGLNKADAGGGNVATCKHLEFARLQAPKICIFKFLLSITINGDNDQWERNNMKEYSVNVSTMRHRLGLHSVEDH